MLLTVLQTMSCAAGARLGACVLAATFIGPPPAHAKEISQAQVEKWLAPGREAAKRGDYARAQSLTEASLSKASQQIPGEHWARAYLMNDLARWKAASGARAPALMDAQGALDIARRAFASAPSRVAYFALDVGILHFQLGKCADADSVLSASLEGLEASPLRNQLTLAASRVAWSMGDLDRAQNLARAVPAPLVVAQIDIEAGRVQRARAELDGLRRTGGLGNEESSWPTDYVEAELGYALAVGDLRSALARAEALVKRSASNSDPAARAAAQHRFGQALSLSGRFAEAERAFNAATRALEQGAEGDSPAAASIHHDLAWTYRSVGDYPRSEFHFERALATAGRCSGPADAMPALMLRERALLRIEQGKVTQALADVDDATQRAATVSGDTRVLRGLLIATRAFALDRLGDLEGSAAAMQAAVELIEQAEGANSLNLPLGYVELADLAWRGGNFPVAQRQATAALTILDARRTQSIWGTGAALSIRGAASAAARAPAAFWSDTERFIGVTERSLAPAGVPTSANQSEIALARRQAERLLDALPAHSPAQVRLVARLMQLPHMSDATSSLQTSALESQSLPAKVRALVRSRAELLEQSQALRSSLLLAQQRGSAIEATAVAALGSVVERLAQADEELLRVSPEVAGQLLQRAIDPADVQRHLRVNEGLILQVLTEDSLHALFIDRQSVIYRNRAVPRKQIRADVRLLRRALDLSLPASDRLPFDAARANALYRSCVGLFSKELAGRDQLVVVADDALQSIPWSVLVDELDSAGAAESFLVNRMSVATVPSLQSFVALRAAPPRRSASEPYVAFADPRMERFRATAIPGLRGGSDAATLDVLRQLPSLPETVAEVQSMAKALGGDRRDLYLGERATEKTLRDLDLSRFQIVSFATHGLMAGEIPGLSEPALLLTRQARATDERDDGLLTASEIAQLSLRADLVILSGCNTGRLNARAGITGVSALGRAFFAAGARSLLVSHWAVASEATALLLAKTVERLAAERSLGAAGALREAMLWMKDSGAGPVFSRPEFWGAFSVVGPSV